MLGMEPSTRAAPVGFALLHERLESYGGHVRRELVQLLPAPLGRVLDVGCARGDAASLLRERGATRLIGVELEPAYAEVAASKYDEVICGSAEGDLPWPPGSFDTILCYDVLEHLIDPWRTLEKLARRLTPGGRVHVSVPNARHPGTWLPLVLRGTFDYRAQGLRDVTHLRFFGRRDLEQMLHAAGLSVYALDVVPAASRAMNFTLRITRGHAREFAAYQWQAVGVADGAHEEAAETSRVLGQKQHEHDRRGSS